MKEVRIDRRGGRRAGAGRPLGHSVLVTCRVPQETFSVLVRLARAKFGKPVRGKPWIGAIISEQFAGMKLSESDAVRLAREAGLLPPLSRIG